MRKFFLIATLLISPRYCLADDHEISGFALPDVMRLEDKTLNPGNKIVMTWEDTVDFTGWKGKGNGIEYWVTRWPDREESKYAVVVNLPNIIAPIAWSLVFAPGQIPGNTIVYRNKIGANGPLNDLYNTKGDVTIHLTPN